MEYSGRATDASPLMKTLAAHHYGWPFARSEEMLARHIFRAISIYYQTTQFIFRCSKTTVNPSDTVVPPVLQHYPPLDNFSRNSAYLLLHD